MKKHANMKAFLVAGAALGAGAVHAQSSMTLYGALDDAFVYSNNQKGHSNVYLRQGNLYASKWGLRGVEDLGGGTSVIFDLQNGFDPNSGALSSSTQIFNREAFVGLQNQHYGTFTMGRQYTPYYLFVGPLASSNWLTGATGAHPGDIDGLDTTIRINNALVYTTPIWYGVQASGMYALGGIAGSTGRGQTISAGIKYASGPIGLAAGYLRMDNAQQTTGFDPASTGSFGTSSLNAGYVSAKAVQHVAAAASYTIGDLMMGVTYTNVEYVAASQSIFRDTAVFNTYAAVAAYRFTPAIDVAGAYSYTMASKANGITSAARYQQYSLKEAYHLSKRTSLYALQAYQRANGQTLGANGAGNIVDATPSVGDSQNATPSSTNSQFVGMVGIAVLF
ncbi:porin [Caballeronia sp. dw_19]|uniref:porin n=1 Tax=Caballeronia sp. dw_19 TaxID=2719791 RepID=UPI001BCD608E|nr:porin [Caballeronia sp. dw_19]